jgi:hypothetical protein
MQSLIDRRDFLLGIGGMLALSKASGSVREGISSRIDHIILGCNDLNVGVDFVSARTGVYPTFGGVHPGAGTRNALLRLGERLYLEILAPDPDQLPETDRRNLRKLVAPRLVGWAVHTDDIEHTVETIRAAAIAATGAEAGSRQRPDGQMLSWKTAYIKDDASGLMPFFIEWGAGSVHPSMNAPPGCHLEVFELCVPDPAALRKRLEMLRLDVPVTKTQMPHLHAIVSATRGKLDLS